MADLGIGDRVTATGTETRYEGRMGEPVMIREPHGIHTHGVKLDGLDGRRWFSPGELRPER